jgi:hypothetical protein
MFQGYYLVQLIRSLKANFINQRSHIWGSYRERAINHRVYEECAHSAIFSAVSKPVRKPRLRVSVLDLGSSGKIKN